MEKRQVNPWTWQDPRRYSQAWRVDGAQAVVFLAGQCPVSSEGELVGEGDFDAQVRKVFENMGTVLEEAGASFSDVVKVTVFLTDITRVSDYSRVKSEFIDGRQPASSAIGVNALAVPGMMVEVEAIAVV